MRYCCLTQHVRNSRSLVAFHLALGTAALVMSGCGTWNTSSPPSTVALSGIHGLVHGGQQPISGSTIQLYQVGVTGYGTGATPLLTTTVQSDVNGNFSITGDYTCTSGTQVYITATGGSAGSGQGANSAIALLTALGLCDNLNANTFIQINEITTVGAVWALNPFMHDLSIGAPASANDQAALAAAFADVNQIVNNASGSTPGPALPTGAVAPVAEIDTLADILAACINTSGPSSSSCTTLFGNTTPAGGSAPTETIRAAQYMAANPGSNVSNLLLLALPTSPFEPTLAAMTDFTLGVTYQVGGAPSAIAIDASNNVWVANAGSNSVTELSRSGSSSTYTPVGLSQPSSIAVDTQGDIWITSYGSNQLFELSSTGSTLFTSAAGAGGLNQPTSVAIDDIGWIWVANAGSSTVSNFLSNGTAVGSGYSAAANPVAVAIDPE